MEETRTNCKLERRNKRERECVQCVRRCKRKSERERWIDTEKERDRERERQTDRERDP